MESKGKKIGIVGGGLLGMTLALRLLEQSFQVTLIESSRNLGGLASPCKIGNYTWDQFYHVILLSDKDLLSLLQKLNLKGKIHWGQTRTGFFTDGHLHSMSHFMEFLTFPPLTLLDKLRLGFTIFYASKIKSWKRLERISVRDWLIRLSGNHTFHKIWLPLLKSKLGENYRLTSASFILAAIARMYAARRSGLKNEMFGYLHGGYATILNKFQSLLGEIGIETICETPVARIRSNNSGVELDIGLKRSLEFNEVILTIPCNRIPSVCPELSRQEKQRFSNVHYQGIICLALILKKPLAGYYITNITDEWIPFTAVIEMTALVDRNYFDGHSLIYLPRYLTERDIFWGKKDEEILMEFVTALEFMYPTFQREDVLFYRITRASEVHPIATLNYSKELLPPVETSLEHVFVVNSAQITNGTMNVNEVIGLANRKAKEIAEILS